jgi:hypothetical protein
VRVPNIFAIESKPFDADTYEELRSDEVDEEGVRKMVAPETAIRWRYSKDENGVFIVCEVSISFANDSREKVIHVLYVGMMVL